MVNKKDNLKNNIDYWRKHQELDKFNYNFVSTYYTSVIAILIALFLPAIIYYLGRKEPLSIFRLSISSGIIAFILTLIFLVLTLGLLYKLDKETKNHNRSFRIRESMLRVWYNEKELGVDTDYLDKVFDQIKEKYNKKPSNKDLEDIAKNILYKNKRKEN